MPGRDNNTEPIPVITAQLDEQVLGDDGVAEVDGRLALRAADTPTGGARAAKVFDSFARIYNRTWRSTKQLTFGDVRAEMASRARGRVLEVGVGTGLNLPLYPTTCELVGLDVSASMLEQAAIVAAGLEQDVTLIHGTVAQLPDQRVDTAVLTWVLCWVSDPDELLRDCRRQMVSGGKLLLLEPSVKPRSLPALLLWGFAIPFTRLLANSRPLHDAAASAERAGFRIVEQRRFGHGLYAMVEAEAI